jgi:transcriptional regulator with AAA-type ATPase domain
MENDKDNWNTSKEIDSVGKAKLDSLENNIKELENMIKERNTLSQNFIKEAEEMKSNIKKFLIENAPEGEGDSEFARERSELRKKQIEISELQLNEKVNCWRDIALLKKEFRENIKELNEKKSRSDMLGRILSE